MKIILPQFDNKADKFKFLHLNKSTLIAQKKSEIKYADNVEFVPMFMGLGHAGETIKANEPIKNPPDVLDTELVINTTNLMDNHDDVHLPGIWDKSIKESKDIMHVQEHKSHGFEYIISDGNDLKVYVKEFSWKELNADYPGVTQALMFDSKVRKERNSFMHGQYSKGYVKQHSVGMRYVQLALAINDKQYGAEFEVWEKYFDLIANKENADELGYFWAVREAKVIEGSAVPKGSNWITPTRFNNKSYHAIAVCPSCNKEFDYNSISESGMGYVKCPDCDAVVTQQNIKNRPSEDTYSYNDEPPEGTLKSFNELLSNEKFF